MRKIRVTRGGCGISYEDEHGPTRPAPQPPEDGPSVSVDAQAPRRVRPGRAAYRPRNAPEAQQEPDDEDPDNQEPEKATGHLDAAELEGWDYNQLKKLAADMGVTPKGRKKPDLIAAITAAKVEPGNDMEPDYGGEDDDLPDLGAADPE